MVLDARSRLEQHMEDLRNAAAAARRESAAAEQAQAEMLEALSEWSDRVSAEPAFQRFEHSVSPQIQAGSLRIAELSASAGDLSKRVLASMDKRLLPALRREWEGLHAMISHGTCPPIPPPLKRRPPQRCQEARMCLCHRQQLAEFIDCWKSAMRVGLQPDGPLSPGV